MFSFLGYVANICCECAQAPSVLAGEQVFILRREFVGVAGRARDSGMTDDGNRENASREAVRLFADGHNCAQAVLGALAPGLGLDRETAVRLATGFGVGLSMGETCGAVSGAILAIGLAYGGAGPDGTEAKLATYALAGEFFDAFAKVHGGLRCRELIGCDPSTPEGMLVARTEGRFGSICAGLVGTAAAIAADMLATRSSPA